ncbi:MAG: alpha/beta fold hydrolase [Phycisphaerae bacterium]|nr:alpha/beta fold hydrolase [Phycisphaerae bacterium]
MGSVCIQLVSLLAAGDPGLTTARVVWDLIARNWALTAIFLTLLILVITPILIIRKYVNISLNILKDTPPPLSRGPRDFVPLAGEEVEFRSFDGLNLRGVLLRGNPDVARRGMVIFAHEYASDRSSCARYCRPLIEAGYDIFSFDFRGHGDSSQEPNYEPRQWASDREVNDMVGAIAYVEDWLEANAYPVKLGIFGISRGAGAAILAAQNDPRVHALLVDGAFSTDTTIEHLMKRWAYIFAKVRFVYENHHPAFWRVLRWCMIQQAQHELGVEFPSVRKALMRMSPRPIFFVHGEKDSYIPVEQTELLYALSSQPKYKWIVPSAKHNQSVIIQPEQYAARTVAFFDRYLAERTPADGFFSNSVLSEFAQPLAEPDRSSTPADQTKSEALPDVSRN